MVWLQTRLVYETRGLGWDKEKKVRLEVERLGRETRWFDWEMEKKVWLDHFEYIYIYIYNFMHHHCLML